MMNIDVFSLIHSRSRTHPRIQSAKKNKKLYVKIPLHIVVRVQQATTKYPKTFWYTKSVKRKCTLNKKKSVPHTRILHHTDESVPAFLSTFNGINTSCKTNKHNIHNNYNVQTRRLTHSSTDTQTSHSAQTHMYVG